MAKKMSSKVVTEKKFGRGLEAGRRESLGPFPPKTVDTKDRSGTVRHAAFP